MTFIRLLSGKLVTPVGFASVLIGAASMQNAKDEKLAGSLVALEANAPVADAQAKLVASLEAAYIYRLVPCRKALDCGKDA